MGKMTSSFEKCLSAVTGMYVLFVALLVAPLVHSTGRASAVHKQAGPPGSLVANKLQRELHRCHTELGLLENPDVVKDYNYLNVAGVYCGTLSWLRYTSAADANKHVGAGTSRPAVFLDFFLGAGGYQQFLQQAVEAYQREEYRKGAKQADHVAAAKEALRV
ncbi:unnamed protein product [Amoebophrya sp. A120]|nr:unnamed protein product [Amoebophrya sp. A120]|eukprot:GSA120T00004248001.1